MAGASAEKQLYTVLVEDNFHHMEGGEQWEHGRYETCEKALEACRGIIDAFLRSERELAKTPEALFAIWRTFGDYPVIVVQDRECYFPTLDYARERCEELYAGEEGG